MATHDHHAHHAHHAAGSDKGPAFIGLFAGMIALIAIMYGVVQWTNAQFEGHAAGGAAAAGAAAKH